MGCPIKLRDGDYRIIENNIIVNSRYGVVTDTYCEDNHDRYLRNIFVLRSDMGPDENYQDAREDAQGCFYNPIKVPVDGLWAEADHNVFWNDTAEFKALACRASGSVIVEPVKKLSIEEWQALGYDRHSVFADPLFVDPENGDYRVKPGSPALELGFENFDMTSFGRLPD